MCPVVARPVVARALRNTDTDAFFIDEESAVKDSSTQCPLNRLASLSAILPMQNPLDDSVPAAVTGRPSTLSRPETIPGPHTGHALPYSIFVPQQVRTTAPATVNVSVLHCPGTEMNRHGLRKFFEGSSGRALITVPGVEKDHFTPSVKPWGVGITQKQISDLFSAAGLPGQHSQVDIVGAFSTGYRGFNGTLNNGLISVTDIKTAVIYDALYRGDTPPPGGNTAAALNALGAGPTIITYQVTGGGTPQPRRANVPLSGLIDLASRLPALKALIVARIMEKGLKDGYLRSAEVQAPIQTLIANGLPARGTLASSNLRAALASAGTLDAWAARSANKPAIASIIVGAAWAMIRDRQLMGWPVSSPDDMAHDGFIPEFGWEFLSTP